MPPPTSFPIRMRILLPCRGSRPGLRACFDNSSKMYYFAGKFQIFWDWSGSGKTLPKCCIFWGNLRFFGIGPGLAKLFQCYILWGYLWCLEIGVGLVKLSNRYIFQGNLWFLGLVLVWRNSQNVIYLSEISTESRCARWASARHAQTMCLSVTGKAMLRGAGRRGTASRTTTAAAAAAPADRPVQSLLLASAATHQCDCGCHHHRPDLDSDDHHHKRGAIQGKEFGQHPVTVSNS